MNIGSSPDIKMDSILRLEVDTSGLGILGLTPTALPI